MYDDDEEYDSWMEEIDNLLYDEEVEEMHYDSVVNEINEYWDRENEYIKSSGIYTKEEVAQILDNHNQIRNEKLVEAKKDYEEAIDWVREQKRWAAEERQLERENRALDRELARLEADCNSVANDINDQVYRAYREERAAYDDFIASLDMADD